MVTASQQGAGNAEGFVILAGRGADSAVVRYRWSILYHCGMCVAVVTASKEMNTFKETCTPSQMAVSFMISEVQICYTVDKMNSRIPMDTYSARCIWALLAADWQFVVRYGEDAKLSF